MSPDSALPLSLHTSYQLYKAGTFIVTKWLWAQAGDKTKSSECPPLAVAEIVSLAHSLSKRRVQPPKRVHDAFKVALVNRKRLTRYFEVNRDKDDPTGASAVATKRHKHFNEALAQCFDLLFPNQTSRTPAKSSPTAKEEASSSSYNRFEALSDFIESELEFDSFPLFAEKDEKVTKAPPAIKDDPMEAYLVLHSYVVEVENLITHVHDIYQDAANGLLPVPLAASLTHAAMIDIYALESGYGPHSGYHPGLLEIESLHSYRSIQKHQKATNSTKPETLFSMPIQSTGCLTRGLGLRWPMNPLVLVVQDENPFSPVSTFTDRQSVNKYFRTPSEELEASLELTSAITDFVLKSEHFDTAEVDKSQWSQEDLDGMQVAHDVFLEKRYSGIESVLRSVLRAIKSQGGDTTSDILPKKFPHANPFELFLRADFQFKSTVPLLAQLEKLVLNTSQPLSSSLVFEINMLWETTEAFVWRGDNPNPVNCRILALKLAQEVMESIREVEKLDEDSVFAEIWSTCKFNIKLMASELRVKMERFCNTKVFDLYHQAPWVAGVQMAAMLTNAHVTAVLMLNESGMLGSFLHMYNMLIQLGVLEEKIDILERFCDFFVDEVFLGSRPEKDFAARRARFLGYNIYQGKSVYCKTSTSTRTNGHNPATRLDPTKLSLFVNNYINSDRGDPWFWESVIQGSRSTKNKHVKEITHTMREAICKMLYGMKQTQIIDNMRQIFEAEFSGPFPIAKVNFFKVITMCCEVWKEITLKYCAPNGVPAELNVPRYSVYHSNHLYGHSSALILLHIVEMDVMERMSNKKTNGGWKEHSGLMMLKDAVVKCCVELKLVDFLWKNI